MNSRHELFAQNVASGKSLTAAYLDVYPNAKKSSAKSAAVRLMKIVEPRVRELQKQNAERYKISRDEIIRRLMEIADTARYDADKVKALAQIAEMEGFNKPQQVNVAAAVVPFFLSPDGTGIDENEKEGEFVDD